MIIDFLLLIYLPTCAANRKCIAPSNLPWTVSRDALDAACNALCNNTIVGEAQIYEEGRETVSSPLNKAAKKTIIIESNRRVFT